MTARCISKKDCKNKPRVTVPPRRPLSAYNIFFKVQRHLIINGKPNTVDIKAIDAIANAPRKPENKKRIHKKSHGKIGFADLAKEISHRWKACDEVVKLHFEHLAKKDKVRYDNEKLESTVIENKETVLPRQELCSNKVHSENTNMKSTIETPPCDSIEPLPLTKFVSSTIDQSTCDYLLSALSR